MENQRTGMFGDDIRDSALCSGNKKRQCGSQAFPEIHTTTCVERKDAGSREIPLEDVVVGDIIHLSAGDMVPADVRILSSRDLFISQSALTGESEPVEKLEMIRC